MLSDRTQRSLEVALGKAHGEEVAAAIATGGAPAGAVANAAALGDLGDLAGVDGTGNDAAPLADTQTALDALQVAHDALVTKVNALLASLRAAGILTP